MLTNPRKKIGLQRVNNALDTVMQNLGLERRLREHTVLNLWPVVVDEMLASKSKALWIDNQGFLVVAVADASTGQELSLMKSKVLKKLQAVANPLGVSVKALRFDMKSFHEGSQIPNFADETRGTIDSHELDAVELTEDDSAQLEQLKVELSLNEEVVKQPIITLNERIVNLFEKELRIRRWKSLNGFPICIQCKLPTQVTYGDGKLCMPCFYAS